MAPRYGGIVDGTAIEQEQDVGLGILQEAADTIPLYLGGILAGIAAVRMLDARLGPAAGALSDSTHLAQYSSLSGPR